MEFNEKLQKLRKQKGFTQEELSEKLFVSRTAVSKWESGRGYPGIDSLKEIAKLFGVTIDELISSDELLSVAEEDTKQKESHFRDVVYGLFDVSVLVLLFLPLFGQREDGVIKEASLLFLTQKAMWLRIAYYVYVSFSAISGVIILALQNLQKPLWVKNKSKISLLLNLFGVIFFIITGQPYAAVFLLVYLVIKTSLIIKKQ